MTAPQVKLLGFITLTGTITAVTGLHIGGTAESIDKGGIDSPVIKNPVTNEPYIPGSSLRGRMRSLIEKRNGRELLKMTKDIYLEHYNDIGKAMESEVCRVFGNSKSDPALPSILVVRDAMLTDDSLPVFMRDNLPLTEAKIEVVIDRITGSAQPRTIERVPATACFGMEIIYKIQTYDNGLFEDDAPGKSNIKCNTKLREDWRNILWALETIEKYTGLGGNSSRGYGKVEFSFNSFLLESIGAESCTLEYDAPEEKTYAGITRSINSITVAIT